MTRWLRFGAVSTLAVTTLLSACGSSTKTTSDTTAVTTTTVAAAATSFAAGTTTAATEAATTTATSVAATVAPTGDANLSGPAEVGAGEKFEVKWTGPGAPGDYVTIVAAGAAKWTDEPWFSATPGATAGSLVAPIKDGAYALWYVSHATDTVVARRAIRVTPFVGALGGPVEVQAGSSFEVAWTGPNGPGDYVTIVAAGTVKWTNESYFYTSNTNKGPGKLVAPLKDGSYELWYVAGTDKSTTATRPITVIPYKVTLSAPAQVKAGATFDVAWTGPNGPQDYVTIVAAGAAPGAYTSYAYTANGSPVKITAPATAGAYELRYASDRVKGITFATINIAVT